jgi:lipoprotein-anchoring transpeptidase ErfK/SrfK
MAPPYPKHVFTVDKDHFLLTRYTWSDTTGEHEPVTSYKCAIGTDQYPTPSGVFRIKGFSFDPDWLIPNSEWVAPEWRGKVIPGGDPSNPLVGAFMDFGFLGVGIHGTHDLDSLGTKASHGCIRVRPTVAKRIARLKPTGSLVAIF